MIIKSNIPFTSEILNAPHLPFICLCLYCLCRGLSLCLCSSLCLFVGLGLCLCLVVGHHDYWQRPPVLASYATTTLQRQGAAEAEVFLGLGWSHSWRCCGRCLRGTVGENYKVLFCRCGWPCIGLSTLNGVSQALNIQRLFLQSWGSNLWCSLPLISLLLKSSIICTLQKDHNLGFQLKAYRPQFQCY